MQERETGKQRSQRIQIDYYRHKGGLDALKRGCIFAGLIGGGLYALYVVTAGGASHTSTGPVARAHASFENRCYECHADLSPIAGDAARPNCKMLGLNRVASIEHTETACQKCHRVGDHYRELMQEESKLVDQNCAPCHSDHQGRNFDLVAVSNHQCASCHAKLADVCTAAPRVKPDTAAFTKADHGDFASLMNGDSGVVKFDHHQHMRPGQVDEGQKGGFTIAMLEPAMRERYRKSGQNDAALVTLDCASCHQSDGTPESKITQIADGDLGRHLKPISFDQHCAACHSMNPAGRTEETLALPHAAPWSEIDLLLQAKITGMRATGKMRAARDDSQPTPQPGVGRGTPAAGVAAATKSEVAAASDVVKAACLKCHDAESVTDQAIAAARDGSAEPMIPGRFLKHGIYDHAAHLDIDCRYCHDAAYPSGAGTAKPPSDHQAVMIAGIDSCTGCHRDAESPTPDGIDSQTLFNGQPTWASDNCTLCHRYHTLPPMTSASLPLASTEASP